MDSREHILTLAMEITPQVATRGRHVLLLPRTKQHTYLLGGKRLYPAGIVRMIGGGVEEGEAPLEAGVRELAEETGLIRTPDRLSHLATVTAYITEASEKKYTFESTIFSVDFDGSIPQPSDDLDEIVLYTEHEIEALIQRYAQLPKDLDPFTHHSWYDYGQLYGPIHQIALEAARTLP